MLRELFADDPLFVVPLGTLLLFLAVFVGVFARAFGRRAGSYDAIARLPLDDGDPR